MSKFCDNPKCRLHSYQASEGKEVIFIDDGVTDRVPPIGSARSSVKCHSHELLDPSLNDKKFRLCDVCKEAASMVTCIVERIEDMNDLTKAVILATMDKKND